MTVSYKHKQEREMPMKNIFEILYRPTSVFERLDKLYEEDLDGNSNLIGVIFGAILGLHSCFIEYGVLKEIATGGWLILIFFLLTLISSVFFVLIYNYVFTYIMYWFGKLLGSKGFVADTRTSIIYSLVPGLISIFVLWTMKYVFNSVKLNLEIQLWTLRIISFVFWFWGMIILVKGLMTMNKYGVKNAILNLLPFVAFGLMYILIKKIIV